MIENRHRIENEVLMGRQTVRRTLQHKEKAREAVKPQSGVLPQPITGTRLPQDGTDTGPVPTTSEAPMSMDTDAEDAFKKGSHWFFKRDTDKSGSSTPRNKEVEQSDGRYTNRPASRRPSWRGSWPSIFHAQGTNDPPTALEQTVAGSTQEQGETVSQNTIPPPSPSIFNRIRRKSVISSPFSTLRRTASMVVSRPGSEYGAGDAEGTWSSDTSSDEELPSPEWRGPKHQQFPSLVNFEDVDDIPILSSPDDEGDDNGYGRVHVSTAEGADPDS